MSRHKVVRIFVWFDGDGWRWLLRGKSGRILGEGAHAFKTKRAAMKSIGALESSLMEKHIDWRVQ